MHPLKNPGMFIHDRPCSVLNIDRRAAWVLASLASLFIFIGSATHLGSLWDSITMPSLQPAVCYVRALKPVVHDVPVQKGCHISHLRDESTTRCAFTALTPGWEVEVTLLSRYPAAEDTALAEEMSTWLLDVDQSSAVVAPLRRHALHSAHTRPWTAMAIPPQHSEHGRIRFRQGTIWAGACASQPWLTHNETLRACLDGRLGEWLPPIAIGSTYPCHAEHYADAVVVLEADVHPSVVLSAVVTTLMMLLATLVACCIACVMSRVAPHSKDEYESNRPSPPESGRHRALRESHVDGLEDGDDETEDLELGERHLPSDESYWPCAPREDGARATPESPKLRTRSSSTPTLVGRAKRAVLSPLSPRRAGKGILGMRKGAGESVSERQASGRCERSCPSESTMSERPAD